jgi:F0F1-type ATP synthase gamma subunit
MVTDLTLVANKVRQESITNELLDILGGTAALEG